MLGCKHAHTSRQTHGKGGITLHTCGLPNPRPESQFRGYPQKPAFSLARGSLE